LALVLNTGIPPPQAGHGRWTDAVCQTGHGSALKLKLLSKFLTVRLWNRPCRLRPPRLRPLVAILGRGGWTSLGRTKNYDWMHVQAAKV
jgi:hypothetical protein